MQSFADACNYVLEVARKHKTTNKVKLQHLCYYDLKKNYTFALFRLSSFR